VNAVEKKQKGITVRHNEDVINTFMGLSALNGTNAAEVLRGLIEQYIAKHRGAAAKKLTEDDPLDTGAPNTEMPKADEEHDDAYFAEMFKIPEDTRASIESGSSAPQASVVRSKKSYTR
jgi:hypothetical protein